MSTKLLHKRANHASWESPRFPTSFTYYFLYIPGRQMRFQGLERKSKNNRFHEQLIHDKLTIAVKNFVVISVK